MRRVFIALSALLVAGSMAAPAALAQEEPAAQKDFTFYGSGFGHGLGMSQWGAYGLSLDGWEIGRAHV